MSTVWILFRSFRRRTVPSQGDVLQAKQTLSKTLLRAGLRAGVVAMTATFRTQRAIAAAGHNVHAIGIGRKVVEGSVTSELCVRVYVIQKLAASLLPPRDSIPPTIDGIPTDVIESAPAFAMAATRKPRRPKAMAASSMDPPPCSSNRQHQQRPVVAGISVAHRDVTAGTLSYFCRSKRHGDDPTQVYALSNNHVFANVNLGVAGDPLLQPGPADGGTQTDHFADLTRLVPIQLGGTTPNRVDAAIGALLPDVNHLAELCSVGAITGTVQATESMLVRKHGRTSGYTEGTVSDVSYDALVGMDHSDPSVVALFENQMRIERIDPYPAFGLGGDSGSLVVSKDNPLAVGLYFAGPGSGVYGVANHIGNVLNELEIQLI
jgi:hypothetical protein